jgi:glucosaminylphosphatidylinositol acyltransferase
VASRRRRNSNDDTRNDPATITQQRVSTPVHRENDKTATELFSYAVIYWTLFGVSRYFNIGGPGVSRRLVCPCSFCYANSKLMPQFVKQVNLPYIAWVAAYNTTILLSYLLLDLAFFPTPLAKSTYSPVSGLKVVRQPSNSRAVSPTRAVPLSPSVPPGSPTKPTQGPHPMPPPALLDAINRNSLAVFLLVRFISSTPFFFGVC